MERIIEGGNDTYAYLNEGGYSIHGVIQSPGCTLEIESGYSVKLYIELSDCEPKDKVWVDVSVDEARYLAEKLCLLGESIRKVLERVEAGT